MRVQQQALAFLALILLALPLRTAVAEVEYYEDYDKALAAAKEKKQLILILLVFPKEHAQFGKGCAHLRETVYSKDPAAAYIARYFAPILVDMAKVQKRKQTPPPVLSLQGNIFIPSAHVFDTDGERVGKVKGVPGNYLAKLKAMVKEKGIEPPPKGARDVSRAFGRGKAAFDRKDYPTAMAELKRVVEAKAPGEELEAARNMIEKVAGQAAERYDKGMDLDEERKLGSAIRAYRECVHMYPDTEGAKKAAARLQELRTDKELRKRLDAFMSASLLRKAEDAMAKRKYAAAAEAADALLARYGATEHAPAAKAIREKLDSNPEVGRALREQKAAPEAQRLLRVAESYTRNRMPQKALATYKQIAEKFPGTSFAGTARSRIRSLGGN